MTVIRKVLTVFGYRSNDTELARVNRAVDQTKTRSLVASSAVGALGGAFRAAAGAATRLVAATSALAVAGGAALAWNIGKDLMEADRLFATLETFEGSTVKAEAAFKRLRKIAVDTPFALTKVVESYNMLAALDLSRGETHMKAWADVAGALGQDVTESTRAVTGAVTGEMEMIKQWGIASKQMGDKVKFTWKENGEYISKTVKKNSEEIEAVLLQVAQAKFAGGAAKQVDTLGGKIRNIKDKMFEFSLSVGKGGVRGALMAMLETVLKLQDALAGTGPILGKLMAKGIDKLTAGLQWFIDNPKKIGHFFGILIGSFKLVHRTVSKVVAKVKQLAPMLAKIGLAMAGGKVLGGLSGLGGRAGSAAGGVSLLGGSLGLLSFGLTDVAAAAMGLPSITGLLFPDLTPEELQDKIKGVLESLKETGKGLAEGILGTELPWDKPEVMKEALDEAADATGDYLKSVVDVGSGYLKGLSGPSGRILDHGIPKLEDVDAKTIGKGVSEGLKALFTGEGWINALKLTGVTRESGPFGQKDSKAPRATGWAGTAELRGVMRSQKEERDRNFEKSGWQQPRPFGLMSDIFRAQDKIAKQAMVTNNVNPTINVIINEASDVEAVKAAFEEQVGVTLQNALSSTYEEMRPSTTGANS